jgi:hypothetical protein
MHKPLTTFIFERKLPYEREDLSVSIDALKSLNLIAESSATGAGLLTSLGKLLARAVID